MPAPDDDPGPTDGSRDSEPDWDEDRDPDADGEPDPDPDGDHDPESDPTERDDTAAADTTATLDMGQEALTSLVAKLTMAGVGFGGVLIFARELGVERFGGYYFSLAVALTLVRISAGVGKTLKKRVSEVDTAPETFLGVGLGFHAVYFLTVCVGTVVAGAVWEQVTATLVALSVWLNAAVSLVPVFDPPTVSPLVAAGVLAVFGTTGLFQVLNRFYAGIGYPGRSFWVDTLRSVLTLAFQLTFLLVFDLGGVGLLAGLALATLLSAVVVAVDAAVVPRLPDRETLSSVWTFARYAVPTAVVTDFYKRVDVFLIGLFAGTGAVGFYEAAIRLVRPADQVAASLSNPLQVKASGRSSLGRDVRADLSNAFTYTGLFGIPMFFGAAAMPNALMRTFFGVDFEGGGAALVGVAAFFVFHIYQLPLVAAIEGTDRPRIVYRVKRAALAVHLLIAVPAALVYGLLGVIGATLLVEVGMFCTYQLICRDAFGGVVLPRPIASQLAAGAVMFGAVAWVKTQLSLASWPAVVGLVGLGAVVYFAVLTLVSGHFRLTAANVLGPVLQRVRGVV